MERGSAGQLLAVNTFVWVTTALYAPFIGAYYAEQGITPFQVGVLTAIGPVVSTLIQPLWAYISDRLGKRRRVLMIVTIGSGLTILTYLLHVSFHAFVAATLCFTVFQTSILPLADALVTQEAARQKANFAKIRMGGTTGYAITALVLGNFLKARPELIFVLGSCGFFLLTFFLRLLPEDKTRQSVEIKKQKFGEKIFKTKQIYLVLLLAFVMQLGLSFTGTFYSVYVMSLGYGQFIVGLSSCISAMSELPVLLFADRLVKKFGAVRLLEFSVFMMATRLLLAGSGVLPLMLASQLLQSVTYMTTYYSCVVFISENVQEGKISQGQSRLAMVQAGIGAVVGSILGGCMTERLGVSLSFTVLAVGMVAVGLVNILIIYYINKKRKKGGVIHEI